MSKTLMQPSKPFVAPVSSPKIALIGCGAIAEQYYLPALIKHPSILDGLILVDGNKARVQKLAIRFNVKNFLADYREVLEEVDGVIVAVPTHLHYPISMEFLARGIHVLCEKPLAESVEKGQQMVDQARQTGVVLAANYQRRLYPNLVKVKELITNRTLGDPLSIKYYVGEQFDWPTASGFYFNAELTARGVLRDRGAHVMDVICWWLNQKPVVLSSQNDSFGGSEAVAHVRFKSNKCEGVVLLSWLSKFPCRFSVECEAGIIQGDIYDYRTITITNGFGRTKQVEIRNGPMVYADMAYTMVSGFIQAISQNQKPLVAGSDVLPSLQFIDECYAAASRFDMPWYNVLQVQYG